MKFSYKIINRMGKFVNEVYYNGVIIAFCNVFRAIINRCYNFSAFKRFDVKIDFTSRIIGIQFIKLGKNFVTGKHFWIEAVGKYKEYKFNPQIVIKNNVSFGDFCHVGATNYIEIGNDVLFGSRCYVTDHNHGIYSGEKISDLSVPPRERCLTLDKQVVIGDNVWIGDNVVVLPDVKIGKASIIGANAVVTKDVPEYTMVVGIPARVIKRWDFEKKCWVNNE